MADLYGVTPQQLRDSTWVDPNEVRAEVLELLRIAREAHDRAPWDARIHRFYEMVFPQMTRWLPADEARWQAWLTEDEPPELVFYCRECAEREFGGEKAV